MCIQIDFILCRSKNIDNPPPTGLYSKVKALHASRTYGNAFQEASGGISCTGTCISPKLPPQRVIARLLHHKSHTNHTVVLIPSDAAGFYTVEMYRYMYRTAVPCRTCGYMVSVPVLAKGEKDGNTYVPMYRYCLTSIYYV